jgi:hypothetical protein
MTRLYYMLLRVGGTVDCVVCYPEEISTVARILNGFMIGEGGTRRDAELDARSTPYWPPAA